MIFTIKKGKKKADVGFLRRIFPIFRDIDVQFVMYGDCWYPDDNGWNQLYGRTFGLIPRRYSVEAVWKPDPDVRGRFIICVRVVLKGTTVNKFMLNINRNEWYRFRVLHDGSMKIAIIGQETYEFAKQQVAIEKNWIGWRKWPYAKNKATKQFKIRINER